MASVYWRMMTCILPFTPSFNDQVHSLIYQEVVVIWLVLILLFPLLEISVFINMGRAFGAGSVILLTIGTAIWGMAMVRIQGVDTYKRIQQTLARGETPAFEMLEGTLLLIAGFFLLLPGFMTDSIGILLLIPPVRKWLALKSFQSPFNIQSRFSMMDQNSKNDAYRSQNISKGRTFNQDSQQDNDQDEDPS